jgi:hypothetical protein
MNKTIKRGLAIAAVAPLALVGFAGSASAVVVEASNYQTLSDDLVQFRCSHPNGSLDLDMQVRVTVEDLNDSDDRMDVDNVRVRVSDDDGNGYYDNEDAHVSKIKVSLLRNFNTVASVTRSDHDVRSDGIRNFRINKDNINQIRVQTWWSAAGFEGDPYTVACVADASGF